MKTNYGFLKRTLKIFTFFVIIFLFAGIIFPSASAAKSKLYNYSRIFYFRDGKLARQSLFNHSDSIDILAPQSYSFNISGRLVGNVKADIIAFAKKSKIKIMPLVTNGNFGRTAYQSILDDPKKQDLAIKSLIDEAKNKNYWGWQFDFEQMDASYRDKYSAFSAKAAEALKKNNLKFSVAVIAQVSSNPSDYPNNLWQKTIGVYDYAALAASADFISVMSYDDPESAGPVVEYSWLKRVLNHSLKFIPNEKLSMGVPLYYWQWNSETGARVGIGGRRGIYNVFAKHKVSVNYDPETEAAFLTYYHRAKQYTIWYENAASLTKKLELVANYKLHGFSAWALGLELPSIFSVIKK